jgi:hypothetical protein
MNPPGYLGAIVAAIKAAAPGLGPRVYSGRAPGGAPLPYAVATDPAMSISPHSNRTAHFSRQVEVSVYAESDALAADLENAIGTGARRADVAAGIHEDWALVAWNWTASISLVEATNSPGAGPVYRRALSFRLILQARGTVR